MPLFLFISLLYRYQNNNVIIPSIAFIRNIYVRNIRLNAFAVSEIKLNVNNNIMSEIVYTIPSTDIFLSMKN